MKNKFRTRAADFAFKTRYMSTDEIKALHAAEFEKKRQAHLAKKAAEYKAEADAKADVTPVPVRRVDPQLEKANRVAERIATARKNKESFEAAFEAALVKKENVRVQNIKNATIHKERYSKSIKAIYSKAREISYRTDTDMEVDHIIPITHPLVCGLNIPRNLQIITRTANRQKSNKFRPFRTDAKGEVTYL